MLSKTAFTKALGATLAMVTLTAASAPHREGHAVMGVSARHLHLIRSEPARNDTLHAPPHAVKLWFTEDPELAITSIKLLKPEGADTARVKLSALHRDAAEHSPVVADIQEAMTPGAYVIAWRTAAKDGHPGAGTIEFVVSTRTASGP